MRIALFSGNYNYLREGANQALNALVAYLEDKAGCDVRVYSPVTATPAFEPAGTLVPVPSITLPVRKEFQLALRLPGTIRRDVAHFAPDIVHVSTPDILGTRAQTFAKKLGVPILASMHTHFETYLDYYGLGWARPMTEAHIARFYRRSDHVVAPTPTLVADMKRLRGDDRASVWSRGIDRELFSPARRDVAWRRAQGFADESIVVLFFGRLVLEKGAAVFVEVLRALQGRAPVQALVVGAGPAAAAFAALPGAVLTGHLEGVDLARAVASADIMLGPSTTETFGNVVLEAMACGVPVVSADAPSARALLIDGDTGLLCPARDVGAYAEAILRLIDAPDIRRAMGASARQASAAYSWDAASESVAKVYRSLVAGDGLGAGVSRQP
ncbi:MAG: glycosyltransferase family 4 protein [Sphingopyxis sp.]|uniref:glycosyltransferase family 4 protein n=1 Tax=Sphingopyxis sp. TaxID=1908224 RepID=UPI003D6D3808